MTARDGVVARPATGFDRVVTLGPEGIATRRFLSGNEPIFAGHYPHFPIYPGVLVLETMLQTVDRWSEETGAPLVFAGVKTLRLFSPATPGDVIDCQAAPRRAGDPTTIDAQCKVAGRLLAKAVLLYAAAPARAGKSHPLPEETA